MKHSFREYIWAEEFLTVEPNFDELVCFLELLGAIGKSHCPGIVVPVGKLIGIVKDYFNDVEIGYMIQHAKETGSFRVQCNMNINAALLTTGTDV